MKKAGIFLIISLLIASFAFGQTSEIVKCDSITFPIHKNNIGKILYDENLYNDVKESLEQLKKLTKTLNTQLENGGLEVKADVDLF